MSTLSIPVLSGFRQSSVAFDGSAPVRAWLEPTGTANEVKAVVPRVDLIRMIQQQQLWRLTFLTDGVILSRVDSSFMMALPIVFLEGVGLKCYDLRPSGLHLSEAGSLASVA